MNISKRWAWLTMLLMGMFLLTTTSCDDDNDDNNTVTPDPGGEAEAESAWLTAFRVFGPNGTVYYMDVTEEVPEELNTSEAVELGLNKSIVAFDDNPYVVDNVASTITRWSVDRSDLSLSPEAILSLASTGYSPELAKIPTFVSEEQAFISDLVSGIIVEWNPSEMLIIEVHNIEPLVSSHENPFLTEGFPYLRNGKIFYPISEHPRSCCEIQPEELGALVAVFDISSKSLEYVKDRRLIAGVGGFIQDEQGDFYFEPVRENGFIVEYFDVDSTVLPSPHTVLKFRDDGTFDPDFAFDLDNVLSIEAMARGAFVVDNKFVFSYYDSNDGVLPPSFNDRYSIQQNGSRLVSVDLTTGEVSDYTALDKYDGLILDSVIDGVNYYLAFSTETDPFDVSHFLRQESFDTFTELSSYDNVAAQRLRKLWGD